MRSDGQRRDAGAAGQRQRPVELVREDRDRARDALLAAGGEAVDRRAAEQHALGAERDGLRDVGAAPHAAVDEEGGSPAHGANDLGQRIESADRAVELPAAVVREHEAIHARRDRALGVVGAQHALQQQLARPAVAEALHVVPGERGIEHARGRRRN